MELKPKTTASKARAFQDRLEGHLAELLEPGEKLVGVVAASQQKGLFSGGVAALAVTDRRLIIQPLDRRGKEVKGEATSISRDEIDKAKIGRAGGAWDSPSDVIMSTVAITVKFKTKDGKKFQFSLMDGGSEALKEFLGHSEGPTI